MILLTEPTLLSKRKIPLSVAQPFIEQWDNIKTQQEDISIQLLKAMKTWIQEGKDPTLTIKRIALVENEFAEQKQKSIDRFKTLSLIHISEPTRPPVASRMPSSA